MKTAEHSLGTLITLANCTDESLPSRLYRTGRFLHMKAQKARPEYSVQRRTSIIDSKLFHTYKQYGRNGLNFGSLLEA